MGKRILITGGSHAELPLIRSAKKRGDYVITTGMNADGLGHKEADRYVEADYSDPELVCEMAQQLEVDAIVSGCNDFAYLSASYACERLGLGGHDSYETALTIHHKDRFRACTRELGIRTPNIQTCKNEEEALDFYRRMNVPVLIKPVDLTGGKGVLLCHTEEEVLQAYRQAAALTRASLVIAEECIQGSNHGASVLLKGGKIVFGFVDNEQYYCNPYLVCGACYPSDVPAESMAGLFHDIETVAQAKHLTDGLFHTQFILEPDKTAVMIDPCRRAPGDLYILLVKYATGVDYPTEILKAECGEPLSDHYRTIPRNIARECIMTDRNGILKEIRIGSELQKDLIDRYIWAEQGDRIEDYFKYKAGILFFESDNTEDLYQKVERFHRLVTVETE